jgi:hypothetical protein
MEYDYSWAMQLAETFLSRCFCFSQPGFMLTFRTTDQACFCYLATFSVGKQSNSEIFELETLEAK